MSSGVDGIALTVRLPPPTGASLIPAAAFLGTLCAGAAAAVLTGSRWAALLTLILSFLVLLLSAAVLPSLGPEGELRIEGGDLVLSSGGREIWREPLRGTSIGWACWGTLVRNHSLILDSPRGRIVATHSRFLGPKVAEVTGVRGIPPAEVIREVAVEISAGIRGPFYRALRVADLGELKEFARRLASKLRAAGESVVEV